MSRIHIRAEFAAAITWSRGSCGNPGCTDASCACALCREPIGLAEEDPRRNDHDDECTGCPVCTDDVPIILFRGEGKEMEQAQFHHACFEKVVRVPSHV